ncbi:MAG TPA: ATP-binding protein [Anaerolineae bacterium]|nr:ATP-binding protein [Anaerolineae bacterium]
MPLLREWETATFQDVADFVKANPFEDPVVEYKSVAEAQDSRGIAKSLSAFANTFGGILIVGVTGKDGEYALTGLPRGQERKGVLVQRIVNSCLDNLHPPVMVAGVREVDGAGCAYCAVARVGPSSASPHFFRGRSARGAGMFECYVRAYGRNYASPKPDAQGVRDFDAGIDLATDLPDLLAHRQQSTDLRDKLVEVARQRCMVWLRQVLPSGGWVFTRFGDIEDYAFDCHPHWEMVIVPAFPREMLLERSALLSQHSEWYKEFGSIAYFDHGGTPLGAAVEPVSTGARTALALYNEEKSAARPFVYLEAGELGLIYLRLGLPFDKGGTDLEDPAQDTLNAEWNFRWSRAAFERAMSLYADGGYVGPLQIAWDVGPGLHNWRLRNIRESQLCTDSTWTYAPPECPVFRTADEFREEARTLVHEAARSLLWAFRVADDSGDSADMLVQSAFR